MLLEEKDLEDHRLMDEIETLRNDPARRARMEAQALAAAPEDATRAIWEEISR